MAFPIVPCPRLSMIRMQPQPTLVPICLYIRILALLPIPALVLHTLLKPRSYPNSPHHNWLHRSLALSRLCWSPVFIREMPAYCTQDCHYFYRTALRGLNICTTVSPLYS
ncbi:hypothetical protein IF2G_00487 [Cordyceps javanica]|nr:hypothetical protein IF2G_00487 [Cordyceps javanica]